MNKREEIQEQALNIALFQRRCGLAISMGVGKTLIGLKYIDGKRYKYTRVLVVAPKLSIFQSWKDDAKKFNIDIGHVSFTTYLSLNKHNPLEYDLLVLDECHSLLYSHQAFLDAYARGGSGMILGLTGTPPRYSNSEKGVMVSKYCPIKYSYITDDAVEDSILNDYRIIVHRMSLSTENNIHVQLKNQNFYTSELKNYQYWSGRVMDAETKKQTQIASVMRMKAMMEYKTKEEYAKKLVNDIEKKCIVFCNTQLQAERICEHSYHSNNPYSEGNLDLFSNDHITKLSCVMQLNEGINIPNLEAGIILHSYGNERKASQRIGRLLRLNPDQIATVHILCYKDTVDDRWVTEALKDLDQTKIKYFDV